MTQSTGRIANRKTQTGASTLPEIGKIKIGEKKVSAKGVEYPSAIDYFRATGTFANEFTKQFGAKPKELKVVFISNDISEVCNQRFECWTNGKRWGWGDGETFTVWDASAKQGKGDYLPNLPKTDPRVKAAGVWDEMLTLRFVLLGMPNVMGYWSFQTKAKAVTIPSIVKSFDLVMERAGSIIGFPFSLIIEKKSGYNPGEPKSYPVVSLIPNFTDDAIEAVQHYIAMGGNLSRVTAKMIETGAINEVKPLEIGGPKND